MLAMCLILKAARVHLPRALGLTPYTGGGNLAWKRSASSTGRECSEHDGFLLAQLRAAVSQEADLTFWVSHKLTMQAAGSCV